MGLPVHVLWHEKTVMTDRNWDFKHGNRGAQHHCDTVEPRPMELLELLRMQMIPVLLQRFTLVIISQAIVMATSCDRHSTHAFYPNHGDSDGDGDCSERDDDDSDHVHQEEGEENHK